MYNTETVLHCKPEYTAVAIAPIGQSLNAAQMQNLGAEIRRLRKENGFSQAALAERLGVEQPTVQRWETGKREPSLDFIDKMAQVFGVAVGELVGDQSFIALGPRLFVKGVVSAGAWRDTVMLPEDEWQEFTGRPGVNADSHHRFGLVVEGDSMNEIYPEGTILECVSVFGHAEALPGKRVIVARMNKAGRYETTCKELVEQDSELWLVPRSTNPAHRPFRANDPEPGITETRIIAVVVSSIRAE